MTSPSRSNPRPREGQQRPRLVARSPTPGVYPTRRAAAVHLALVALLDIVVIALGIGVCAGLMWLFHWPPLPPVSFVHR